MKIDMLFKTVWEASCLRHTGFSGGLKVFASGVNVSSLLVFSFFLRTAHFDIPLSCISLNVDYF